jgi:mannose-6-phosphate isomerase
MTYPLKLKYVSKTALWGGSTLKNEWNKPCDFEKLSETWELSVRDDAVNTILNGEYAGKTLDVYLAEHKDAAPEGKFPLLIKFIDADDSLSVQVHPDDKFAAEVENDVGKTEMWYIADAKEGAELIYGVKKDAGALMCDERIEGQVNRVKVKKGDSFFIPAGMLHAIGKGCLIAEIQQNSDLTYRVYDYCRRDAAGNLRQLHTDKALKVVRYFDDKEIDAIRFSEPDAIGVGECLASSRYFKVNRLTVTDSNLLDTNGAFNSILCVEGSGEILSRGKTYPFERGDSYFIPADLGKYEIRGNATVLISKA